MTFNDNIRKNHIGDLRCQTQSHEHNYISHNNLQYGIDFGCVSILGNLKFINNDLYNCICNHSSIEIANLITVEISSDEFYVEDPDYLSALFNFKINDKKVYILMESSRVRQCFIVGIIRMIETGWMDDYFQKCKEYYKQEHNLND